MSSPQEAQCSLESSCRLQSAHSVGPWVVSSPGWLGHQEEKGTVCSGWAREVFEIYKSRRNREYQLRYSPTQVN